MPFQTLAEATIDANREMQIALQGQRFQRGRGELYGEAAAAVYGEVRGEAELGLLTSPPSPFGLWRGSLRSLRYDRLPGLPSRSSRSERRLVEPGGIEPPTSSLRTTRSPS